MGLLRLYLAICVVSQHATAVLPWAMHDGMQAVQIFYIISGFYMAMVLSAKRYASVRLFYASRFLRIFPVTWLVLLGVAAASAVFGIVGGHWMALAPYVSGPFRTNGAQGVLIAAASNLTLFGQDWVMFLSQPRGSPLAVTSNFWIDPHPLFFYLLVPQAWSVGLELCFYLIVPFVNRLRTITIAAIAAASLIVRLTAYAAFGLDHDPWTYRFFPFEMFSFLLGMLAYRLYVASRGRLPTPAAAATAKGFAVASIAALITFYGAGRLIAELSRHVDIAYGSLLTYPLWALLVAGLFAITRTNTYDRTLGELSFPIYLVHYFVIAVARGALERASLPQFWLGPLSAILSIGIAVVLLKWCIEPIDRARHVLASGGAVTPSILPMTAAGLERPVESA